MVTAIRCLSPVPVTRGAKQASWYCADGAGPQGEDLHSSLKCKQCDLREQCSFSEPAPSEAAAAAAAEVITANSTRCCGGCCGSRLVPSAVQQRDLSGTHHHGCRLCISAGILRELCAMAASSRSLHVLAPRWTSTGRSSNAGSAPSKGFRVVWGLHVVQVSVEGEIRVLVRSSISLLGLLGLRDS